MFRSKTVMSCLGSRSFIRSAQYRPAGPPPMHAILTSSPPPWCPIRIASTRAPLPSPCLLLEPLPWALHIELYSHERQAAACDTTKGQLFDPLHNIASLRSRLRTKAFGPPLMRYGRSRLPSSRAADRWA